MPQNKLRALISPSQLLPPNSRRLDVRERAHNRQASNPQPNCNSEWRENALMCVRDAVVAYATWTFFFVHSCPLLGRGTQWSAHHNTQQIRDGEPKMCEGLLIRIRLNMPVVAHLAPGYREDNTMHKNMIRRTGLGPRTRFQ
jgi:hypothetical protein